MLDFLIFFTYYLVFHLFFNKSGLKQQIQQILWLFMCNIYDFLEYFLDALEIFYKLSEIKQKLHTTQLYTFISTLKQFLRQINTEIMHFSIKLIFIFLP